MGYNVDYLGAIAAIEEALQGFKYVFMNFNLDLFHNLRYL